MPYERQFKNLKDAAEWFAVYVQHRNQKSLEFRARMNLETHDLAAPRLVEIECLFSALARRAMLDKEGKSRASKYKRTMARIRTRYATTGKFQ